MSEVYKADKTNSHDRRGKTGDEVRRSHCHDIQELEITNSLLG